MKTIKKIINGEAHVRRMADKEAAAFVENGGWHYVPKSVWKRFIKNS